MKPYLVLGCDRSASRALADLCRTGYVLPDEVEYRTLPCSGSLDVLYILRAFEQGFERVLVLSCNDDACRSLDGSRRAAQRSARARTLLSEVGVNPRCVSFRQISPTMAAGRVASF